MSFVVQGEILAACRLTVVGTLSKAGGEGYACTLCLPGSTAG